MSSFRLATISDYWRSANNRQFPTQIKKIKFDGCPALSNLTIELDRGILAICGANGVGKSSLIKMLFNSLCNKADNTGGRAIFQLDHVTNEKLEITLTHNSQELSIRHDTEHSIDVCLFDPCTIVPLLQRFYQELSDLDEVLETHGNYDYDSLRLERLNYLSNHAYQKVTCSDIEDEFSSFPLSKMPYFTVTNRHGVTYNSKSMGLGEFSLFYFDWLIQRAISGSCKLIILEEPESYLPPSIQSRLINVVAFLSDKHAIQPIICTHSDSIISRIDRNRVITIRKVGDGLRTFDANSDFQSLQALGLVATKKGIIFCEDNAALAFAKHLVAYSKNHVVDNFYYHISGSNGDIESILKCLPSDIDRFQFFGLFDGDCKARNQSTFSDKKYGYLPGDNAPEDLLIPYFESLSTEAKSKLFSKSDAKIELAMDHIQGLEAHDYLTQFFSSIQIEVTTAFDLLVENYLKEHRNTKIIKDCIKIIDGICSH
ncbi:ATP-dependent endonuclease [Vibrio cyclitrophicus]